MIRRSKRVSRKGGSRKRVTKRGKKVSKRRATKRGKKVSKRRVTKRGKRRTIRKRKVVRGGDQSKWIQETFDKKSLYWHPERQVYTRLKPKRVKVVVETSMSPEEFAAAYNMAGKIDMGLVINPKSPWIRYTNRGRAFYEHSKTYTRTLVEPAKGVKDQLAAHQDDGEKFDRQYAKAADDDDDDDDVFFDPPIVSAAFPQVNFDSCSTLHQGRRKGSASSTQIYDLDCKNKENLEKLKIPEEVCDKYIVSLNPRKIKSKKFMHKIKNQSRWNYTPEIVRYGDCSADPNGPKYKIQLKYDADLFIWIIDAMKMYGTLGKDGKMHPPVLMRRDSDGDGDTAERSKLMMNFKKHFLNVLKGVRELHSNNFAHFDIKPENILVNYNKDTNTIIDMVLTDYEGIGKLNCGTHGRSALGPRVCPLFEGESIRRSDDYKDPWTWPGTAQPGWSQKSDIWSLAVTIGSCVTGKLWVAPSTKPWDIRSKEIREKESSSGKTIQAWVDESTNTYLPTLYKYEPVLTDLLYHMFTDPEHRYSIVQVIEHDWLKM